MVASNSFADQPALKFDVPALVCVSELEIGQPQVDQSSSKESKSNELPWRSSTDGEMVKDRLIEIVVPVSVEIAPRDRDNVEEIRFDVSWNRNAYPLADYGPKTQTVSDIEGLISVEKSNGQSSGIGLNVSGSYEVVSGSAKAETSKRNDKTVRYQEVPEHDVLIASGTIRRGTGAFFRYHPSRRTVFEGGREIVLAYRVPSSWRGGILKIECRASGNRKVLGTWSEPFEVSRAFIVPIHIEDDLEARSTAMEFAQSEQELRGAWNRLEQQKKQDNNRLFTFAQYPPLIESSLPEDWVHHLIQSGDDSYLANYKRRLPKSLRRSAEDFVEIRSKLLAMSK